jgi:exonuclease III
VTQLSDWCDQYRAELEKNASERAATIEGLLIVGDYQACRDWLDQWQEEDNCEESPAYKYNQAKTLLRLSRCCRGKTSADEMENPSAGFVQNTED